MIKLGRKEDGEKYVADELAQVSLEEVKKMIVAEEPGAFDKPVKKAAAKKKTATKKKAAPKKK